MTSQGNGYRGEEKGRGARLNSPARAAGPRMRRVGAGGGRWQREVTRGSGPAPRERNAATRCPRSGAPAAFFLQG